MRLTVLIAAVGLVAAARAEEPGFLFDALRLPHYHLRGRSSSRPWSRRRTGC